MDTYLPPLLLTYLAAFRPAFSTRTWPYFQGFIWALLVLEGRKCVTRLSRACVFIDRHLASWERFLSQHPWDLTQVTAQLVSLLGEHLGEALLWGGAYLVALDTTFIAKVKGRMLGVQRWKITSDNPDRGEHLTGHQWALAGLLARFQQRELCFPVLTRLVSGARNPSHFKVSPEGVVSPMTFWDCVLAVVFQMALLLKGRPFRVVADAAFSKAPFLEPLLQQGITVISRLRHDAVGWEDPPPYSGRGRPPKRGKRWKLKELWGAYSPQTVRACLYGQVREVAVVVRQVWLRGLSQKVQVVVTQGFKEPILLVCTDLSLTAAQILEIYAARFSLELALRDLKGYVGMGDYQSPTTGAILRFVQLCCVALGVGRLVLLRPEGASEWLGESSKSPVSEVPWSFGRLRRGLRRFALRRMLFSKFAVGADFEKVSREAEALLRLVA